MLLLVIIAFACPSALLASKCGDFSKSGSTCFSQSNRNDLSRLYSSWTRLEQSRQFYGSKFETVPKKCEPVMFYMLTRQSIRNPKTEELAKMFEVLPKIQDELAESYANRADELCSSDYHAIKSWSLKVQPEQASRIAPNGIETAKELAKQFYFRYQSLFDPEEMTFEVGITSKNITYETADAFIEGISDLEPEIREKIDFKQQGFLETEVKCPNKEKSRARKSKQVKEIDRAEIYEQLRKRVSERMGFQRTISVKELDTIYKTCAYEQAMYDTSPWCAIFSNMELALMENKRDLVDYYVNGPGSPIGMPMACPLVRSIYDAITQAIRNPENRYNHLYFTHAGALSHLYTFFGLYDKFELEKNFCPKDKNQWKTSALIPFNANFDVVLYRCSSDKDTTAAGDYKLVTMVNGSPVTIDKCSDSVCSADKFLKEYKNLARMCRLESLCEQLEAVGYYDDDL